MANRYWVGGTGTWDASNTANWSTTSGGASGASVPTASDYVTINSSSGGGTITLAIDASIQGLDIRTFTGTLDFSTYKISCGGNALTILRQDATATVTGTKQIELTYSGATGTRTTGLGGVSLSNALNVKVIAGTDIFDGSSSGYFNNLDFTGFSGSWTNRATIIYGNLTISTGMTPSAGTGVITFAGTSGVQQITTNGKTLDFPITMNGVGGTVRLEDNLTMGSARTFILTTGTVNINGKILSCGFFAGSTSNARTLAFGTGSMTLTGNAGVIFSASTATNFTVTGTPVINCTYSGSTGNRQINGGGITTYDAANPKLNFNITAGADTFVFGGGNVFGNMDFTGFSGTINSSSGINVYLYGDFKLSSTCTPSFAAGPTLTFSSTSGTKTITCAGTTIGTAINFDGVGGTWEFADALTQSAGKAFTITNGTVKLKAGATSTVGAFATSGSNQKYLQSTTAGSQATLSQASGTVNVSYLTIKDINATGGATWNAYVDYNNVDQGDNTGWDFSYSPAIDNEFPVALRSFTQPKRF